MAPVLASSLQGSNSSRGFGNILLNVLVLMGARGVNNEEAIAIASEAFVSIFVSVFRTQ